jgi:amino acid adenylation domain-containing protein
VTEGTRPVRPRTPVEESLCKLWAALADADEVGTDDDFFRLGGDSIAAIHLIARIRGTFAVEIPFGDFVRNPTVAATAQSLEEATPGGPQSRPIPTVPPGEHLPLSFVQERIWVSERLQDGPSLFNCPACLRLVGPLDVRSLEASLNEIIRRHDVLRSRLPAPGGHVELVIDPERRLALEPVTLPALPVETLARDVARRAAEFVRGPFDMASGPLFRACLLRVDDRDHRLLLAFHHAIFDGLSTRIVFRELAALYGAFATGQPSPLAHLPMRYTDFARWHRAAWQGARREQLRSYWKKTLAGPLPVLALPTDFQRPAAQGHECGRISSRIPRPIAAALKALGRREGATLFTVLLTAYMVLTARCSGQEDLLVGTPMDSRTQTETEGLIGCFVNTLVLRADLSGHPTFLELLRRVRQVALDAYAHSDMPFEQLVEELRPPRDPARAAVYQTVLQLRPWPAWKAEAAGLAMEEFDVFPGRGRMDLALTVGEELDGLACTWDYSSDLFDKATIERMAGRFGVLIESALANPGRSILELDILPADERRRVLHEWNATSRVYPKQACVHRLVEPIAREAPNRVALEHLGRGVTFGELNRRANQLGRFLSRSTPLVPGDVVGVCLDRAPEVVTAMLAVLKAGAAFLPLNPDVPRERLEFMVRHADAKAVITSGALAGRFDSPGPAVIRLDADERAIDRLEYGDLPDQDDAKQPAYVIYTSGSTGRPKGVLVSHRSLVNYARAAIGQYGLSPADRRLQFASVDSDFFVSEVFTLLLSGGTLVFGNDRGAPLLSDYLRTLAEQRITLAAMPSAYWHEWAASLTHDAPALPPDLRLVITGMDSVRSDLLRVWRDRIGGRLSWLNAYGPTETTCASTYYQPDWRRTESLVSVPIGRPIANTRVYILDPLMNPAPIGVPGEIYIGGDGVALGYVGDPGLTAERFMPDPFHRGDGGRLFRTGDLGRFLGDGNIEFRGRSDLQVKIRGFRVEVEEIERVLCEHPGVRNAAVAARQEALSEKHLEAFVVVEQGPAPSPAELRAYLQRRLPAALVPSRLRFLDALPLLPGGKVDRQGLPLLTASDALRADLGMPSPPPRSEMERALAEIWREALQVEEVGIADNFFDIGGHSLLAVSVLAQIERRFGMRIQSSEMVLRTLGQLALLLDQRLQGREGARR